MVLAHPTHDVQISRARLEEVEGEMGEWIRRKDTSWTHWDFDMKY